MGDPNICVYQSIFNPNDRNDANIIQCFIINGLGLYIKLNIFVENMLYACSFSDNISVSIPIKQNKYYISLNAYTTVISWGVLYFNVNRTQK